MNDWDLNDARENYGSLNLMKRMLRDLLKNRIGSAKIIVSLLGISGVGMIAPLVLGFAVDSITTGAVKLLLLFAILYGGLYVLNYVARKVQMRNVMVLAQWYIKELRDKSFRRLQKVPISFFTEIKTGRIISRLTNDAEALSDFLTFQVAQVVSGMTTVVASVIIMSILDPSLTLYSIAVIPALFIFSFSIQGKVRKRYLNTRRAIATLTGTAAEDISGIRAIKGFATEDRMNARFSTLNKNNLDANLSASRLASFFSSIVRMIEASGIALVIYAGAGQAISGVISVGLLVAFLSYVQGFFDPVIQLSQFYNSYQSATIALGRLYQIIDYEEEADKGRHVIENLSGGITFENVSMKFNNSYALKDVSFTIDAGEKVAIVGHTGAGKTTLANMILKFYHPTSGRISVNGIDLEDVKTAGYRDITAVVLQEPLLFKDSIIGNVRYSKPEATDEEIGRIFKQFGLDDIFSPLPDGLHTEIGERGNGLSEGQKQAISIVRAIIRNPQLIIMDEATSQLDLFTERRIQEALAKFLEGRTVIVIAHRLSTISFADKIVVLDHGRIEEEGEFRELISHKGLFYKLYETQNVLAS